MKVLGAVLILFALGLVGQTSAVSYCCRPNCGVCRKEECGNRDVCTNFFFNTCCADEKRTIMVDSEKEYFEAIAAGEVNWED